MKYLLATIVSLFAITSHASGKLSAQVGAVDNDGGRLQYQLGLGVYEKITKRSALNMWSGFGTQSLVEKEDVTWVKTKAQVDMYFGKWTVAPGIELAYVHPYDEARSMGFIKVDYKLW